LPALLQLNGSSLPGGEQSCPQTLPAHSRVAGGLPPHPRSGPVTTHSPAALQLNGSSLPGGEQSWPQALPEQTFVEEDPLLERPAPEVSEGDATRPEQAMPSKAIDTTRKDVGRNEERGEALMVRVNVVNTARPFAGAKRNIAP
jgi:hypothetical protein